ncbi:hypothetical protein ACVGWR_00375, partial [Enterobacter hormaechei]
TPGGALLNPPKKKGYLCPGRRAAQRKTANTAKTPKKNVFLAGLSKAIKTFTTPPHNDYYKKITLAPK